ncbi:MAG: flagellar hook-basal body protein [Opitutales bacterium]
MNIGLYQGAASLDSLEQWQNATAHNLAFATAAGFKKAGMAFNAVEMGAMPSVTGRQFEQVVGGLTPSGHTEIIHSQGAMVYSEQPTHAALQGPGFFEVEDINGDTIYTRDGQFLLNNEGRLVTKSGLEVKGQGGSIQTVPGQGTVHYDARGNVFQGTTQIGSLAISKVDALDQLVPRGTGFALPAGSDAIVEPLLEAQVVPGAYEASNVSPVEEMVKMIQISRAYEASQEVIQTYDERYEQSATAFRV